jgi:DNA-binding NtrC family response regulator
MYRLLIVDDEISMLKGIEFNLQENPNYELHTASDKETALKLLASNEIDLVVSDLMMPEIKDGIAVMKAAKKQWYQPSVLAMTAFETVENAVKAMQAGADDFISKGFGIDELSFRIENMLKKKQQIVQLANENRILKETIQQHYSDYNIIGSSKQTVGLIKRVRRVAKDAKSTCLIQGDSGTGKELIARAIHASSRRKNAPFVPVNCAAIPETLIESELFGHEKGAFTGAITFKKGKFELARGGIIFFDEIAELSLALQVRLLRFLEERSFYRIGGKYLIDVDVMILSATNKDLFTQVKKGLFREDLYFRLNVINISIPPLKERREDIRPLAQFFLNKFNRERKKKLKFSDNALEILESYDFPGNVRELRNIIEDAFVFCNNQLIKPRNLIFNKLPKKQADEINPIIHPNKHIEFNKLSYKEAIEKFDSQYFSSLLQQNFWNINEAAKSAGLSREWLSKKMKKMDIKKM